MKEILLPPWMEHPDLPRYSLGWRMGLGESFLMKWDEWSRTLDQEKLVEYFKLHLPLPVEWLDWVALKLGHKDVAENILAGGGKFEGIYWLESQELANFNDFRDYYVKKFNKSIS
jgi:hypothetical protein